MTTIEKYMFLGAFEGAPGHSLESVKEHDRIGATRMWRLAHPVVPHDCYLMILIQTYIDVN